MDFADCFRRQVEECRRLGSEFTAELCQCLADQLDETSRFGRRIMQWQGDPNLDALALRAAAAFHALARTGNSAALAAVYPPSQPSRKQLWAALGLAIRTHDDFLCEFLDNPPQTNEIARCSVILAGLLEIARETELPISLYEIGSSAGLNLWFDLYRYQLGDHHWGNPKSPILISCQWHGKAPALDAPLAVSERVGCDRAPLDPGSEKDRERLLSYIWPDQPNRLGRTKCALDLAARENRIVDRCDAAEWVRNRLVAPPPSGQVRVLMHTIVWQYLAEQSRKSIEETMRALGEQATVNAPLAWLQMEDDGIRGSAGIRLTMWPGGHCRQLGRADYHGRWVEWNGGTS